MMNKYILIFGLLLSWLLFGCGTVDPPEIEEDKLVANGLPPFNPDIPSDPITLEVWLDLDFTRNNTLFEKLAEDFETVYPQVEVEIFSFVRESIPQRVAQDVTSNVPPDVVQGHVYAMAGRGLAEPLEQRWREWETEKPDARTQFLPATMSEVTWEGDRYGIPVDIYTLVLLYNRDHFDRANLAYPEGDYDLFYLREAAEILTQPENERYGQGFTTEPWYVYAWVTAAGGDLLSGDSEAGFSLAIDTETNVDALVFLTEMVEAGYGPLPSSRPRDYEEARDLFLQGKISMYFGEPQDIHLIQSTQPDFPLGVAQLPKTLAKESAASVLGSSGLFMPRGASHPEAAFELMKWMVTDRYIIPISHQQGRLPAKKWVYDTPEYTTNLSLVPVFNQLEAARPYRLDLFPKAEDAFADAVKASFYGISLPREALQEAQHMAQNDTTESEQ